MSTRRGDGLDSHQMKLIYDQFSKILINETVKYHNIFYYIQTMNNTKGTNLTFLHTNWMTNSFFVVMIMCIKQLIQKQFTIFFYVRNLYDLKVNVLKIDNILMHFPIKKKLCH